MASSPRLRLIQGGLSLPQPPARPEAGRQASRGLLAAAAAWLRAGDEPVAAEAPRLRLVGG